MSGREGPWEVWRVPDVARYLGCCQETVRRMFRDGRLSSGRVGRDYVTTRARVLRDLDLADGDDGSGT